MKVEDHHDPFGRMTPWPDGWPPIVICHVPEARTVYATRCDFCLDLAPCRTFVESAEVAWWCCSQACAEQVAVNMAVLGTNLLANDLGDR